MIKVLIAVDDTDESAEAAALARRLFGDQAEYLAINVFEHPLPIEPRSSWPEGRPVTWGAVWPYSAGPDAPVGGDEVPEISAHDVAESHARDAAERAGLDEAELIGEVGDPADAILGAADEHDVDVVVVGSHRRSWLSRLLSHPVSAEVVKRANVPVLVAK